MSIENRHIQWNALERRVFDVAVIGGGINGVCLYHHLCKQGFSVLLVDKGDFAGGTSQASAMMIWGGLLYLRNWELFTVRRLCTSRDRMLREMSEWIKPRRFRYIPDHGRGRGTLVHAALHFYWLLGGCRRLCPRRESDFSERAFLNQHRYDSSIIYEEAFVEPSDARFVLHWLLPYQNGVQTALNYCSLEGGAFDRSSREWYLDLSDSLIQKHGCVRARWVINAAGVWTDGINDRFGLVPPIKHVLSKGVFIALKRDRRHEVPLLFNTRDNCDRMSLIPWGPVSLWGPTETVAHTAERGYTVQPEDVRSLLNELNRHLANPVGPEDIVSLRCGIRPLAVDRLHRDGCNLLSLSRRHRIHREAHVPWISIYGGKLTNCVPLAREVVGLVKQAIAPRYAAKSMPRCDIPDPRWDSFPQLHEPIPSARWCADREMCWTLEDYLRRRTNVSQWVARGGLGRHDEHVPHIIGLAKCFARGGDDVARKTVMDYRRKITDTFDRILALC